MNYREKLQQFKGQRNSLQKLLEDEQSNNIQLKQDYIDCEMASDILQTVGMQTQDNLKFRIESLVTAGLEYVFDHPYTFKVEFDIARGNSQCNLFFERDGMTVKPVDDSGGGALDTASFALRIAMWSLQSDRSSPVFILDEPGRFVSRDLRERFAEFLKKMSDKLGIQLIIVTHDDSAKECADNTINIIKQGNYSREEK